jgi:hypothetical protein
MKLLKNLQNENKIHPPKFLVDNVHYATIMGSMAYGCNTEESDYDSKSSSEHVLYFNKLFLK